jgi:hypothetical protein
MAASTTWAASQQKLYCNRDEMLHLHYLRQQKASLSAVCEFMHRAAKVGFHPSRRLRRFS